MSDIKTKVAFLNHDMRNNFGSAISSLELLADTVPNLKDEHFFSIALAGLQQAIELSNEISAVCSVTSEDAKRSLRPDLKIFPVKEFWAKYSRQDYQKLRKLYDIEINDEYITLDKEKFGAVNPSTMTRVRENIINNAINAGATKIDITYEMQEHAGSVTFKDNGRGLSQAEIDKIMLCQCRDGVIHGVGTKSIIGAINENGFYLSYSSNKNDGASIRIIFPYINS